ncbi:hypothetical protein FACS189441_1790 [Betaproteobacteria bacterium]|nr:hypothetical protein FACS189441_1790 [Betaproteobacteria bacterium]
MHEFYNETRLFFFTFYMKATNRNPSAPPPDFVCNGLQGDGVKDALLNVRADKAMMNCILNSATGSMAMAGHPLLRVQRFGLGTDEVELDVLVDESQQMVLRNQLRERRRTWQIQNIAPTKQLVQLCQQSELRPEALYSAQTFAKQSDIPLWHGRRVVALDGTTRRVPDVPECAAYFGGMRTSCGKFRPLARASVLLDVARGGVVDAVIGGYAQEERSLAASHFPKLNPDDLLVMDRGDPSRKLFHQLRERKIAFCARINSSWSQVRQFVKNHQEDAQINPSASRHPLPLRLVRADLPNGTSFVLVTNILDATHTPMTLPIFTAAAGALRKCSSSPRRVCRLRTGAA